MTDDLVSRDEARARGLKRFFTGRPCKRGHVAQRLVSNGNCATCDIAKAVEWKRKNPEKSRAWARLNYSPEKAAAYYLKWKTKDPERARKREREAAARYREKNPEKAAASKKRHLAKVRAEKLRLHEATAEKRAAEKAARYAEYLVRKAAYRRANQERYNFYAAKRVAAKINACPPWLSERDLGAIKALYAQARRLTEGGAKHHVDHIVPLQGKDVCGLHVPWNMQILSAKANVTKSRKHDPDIGVAFPHGQEVSP